MAAELALAGVLGALAQGVAVHDSCGKLILACPTASRILDLARERMRVIGDDNPQWYGKKEGGRPHADELPLLTSLRTAHPARNVLLRLESSRSSGTWILAHTHVVEGLDNAWHGCVISTFVNITARKSIVPGLFKHRVKLPDIPKALHVAIEAGQIGAWEFDAPAREFRLDARMLEMVGMPIRDSVPESVWYRMIKPRDQARFRQWLLRIPSGKHTEPLKLRIRHPDGSLRHFLVMAAALFDAKRQPTGIVGLALDRTNQMQIEENILRYRRQLQNLMV